MERGLEQHIALEVAPFSRTVLFDSEQDGDG